MKFKICTCSKQYLKYRFIDNLLCGEIERLNASNLTGNNKAGISVSGSDT